MNFPGKFKSFILLTLFIAAAIGCSRNQSSPILDEILTKDNLVDIAEKMKDDPNISKEDIDHFITGMARFQKDSLTNQTVVGVIQKDIDAQRLGSAQSGITAATRMQILVNHGFYFGGTQKAEADGKKFLVAVFDFENKSNKTVTNFQGLIKYFNNQNQLVKVHTVDISKEFAPGERKKISNPYPYNENNERDNILWNAGQSLRVVWEPKVLKFDDDSILSLLPKQN